MKKILSIVLAIAMMLSIVTPVFASTFEDIDDSDYKVAIERLTALEIINGRSATEFDPDGIVTRAEMAKLLVVSLGLKTGATLLEGTAAFNDTADHWANGFINVAAQYGLIKGDGDGNFRPDDPVSYAEAVTMCLRALNYNRVIDKAGEWPTNYLNKGLELKLFDDVKFENAKDGANRGSIAQLMWNMLNAPMWVVTQESEVDGIYYGKTGETMLELKFPDYEVAEYEFAGWTVDVDKDEYVVSVKFTAEDGDDDDDDDDEYAFEYAGNDFYTFVPGTIVEALTYKGEDCISLYATDENYLAEGYAKDLAEKYEAIDDAIDDGAEESAYLYLLLTSNKKDATIINLIAIEYDDAEIVTKVDPNRTSVKINTDYFDYEEDTYTIDNDDVVGDTFEKFGLIIKDGERVDATALKEGDVFTWINGVEDNWLALAAGSTVTGNFDGITFEEDKDSESVTIEISGKSYSINDMPMFFETEVNDDEEEQVVFADLNVLSEKEKDNDYLGKKVTAYFDEYGRLVKVVFEPVETTKSAAFYLAVDGEEREVTTKEGTTLYAQLENESGSEIYAFEEDYDFNFLAGGIYWVEFNTKGEIEEALTIAELDGDVLNNLDAYDFAFGGKDDDDYLVDYIAGKAEDDYGYIGVSDIKVSATTTVFSIVELLDDEDDPTGEYTLKVGKGLDDVDGLENFVVVVDPDVTLNRAAYVIAVGDSESTEKSVGIVDKYTTRNDVTYVTISGTKYELDDDSMDADPGTVVAFTENDGEAKIVYVYEIDELGDAGEVTRVKDEFIFIDEDPNGLDLDVIKEELIKENDFRVFVIDVDYDDDDPFFDAVKEIDVDDISIKKGDFLAIDMGDGYLAIIKGCESRY